MENFIKFLIFNTIFLICFASFAQPPVVTRNVHVIKNATAAQCSSGWKGQVAPEDMVDLSRFGDNTGISGPGVRTCDHCAIDPVSHDCVCRTCYDYFNE